MTNLRGCCHAKRFIISLRVKMSGGETKHMKDNSSIRRNDGKNGEKNNTSPYYRSDAAAVI